MTTATAASHVFPGGALRAPVPTPRAALRLLPAKVLAVPLNQLAPLKSTPQTSRQRETFALLLLVAALHGALAWGVLNRAPQEPVVKAAQEIELIRPPEILPEPPKPVVQPKTATPPPALRTPVAEAPQPNTLTVPENLTAIPGTGPVVAAPPAPPGPPARVDEPITEANGAAAYLNNPPPTYPKAAQRLGLQGRVILRVHVLANGRVGNAEVKDSSGKAILDDAAMTAVRGWVFTPAKRGATPIDGWTQVPIEFKLS